MPTRRGLLRGLLSTSIGASLISAFYPVARFLIPPLKPEAEVLNVVAARSEEVVPNSGLIFKFGTRPGIVVRSPTGELKAFSATCTHLDCTVQYRPDQQGIFCACHEGRYDLNGIPTAGPPPRPLEEYSVNENRGEIVVSKVT